MSTYTQILYQIVFSPKDHAPIMEKGSRDELYRYISGVLRQKKCHVYIINGVEDHLHILTHVHPSVSLSSLIKDIKLASSAFIKKKNLFSKFSGWQEGYGAFTYAYKDINVLFAYVKNQEAHHRKISFRDEYRQLLKEHGIEFDDRYIP